MGWSAEVPSERGAYAAPGKRPNTYGVPGCHGTDQQPGILSTVHGAVTAPLHASIDADGASAFDPRKLYVPRQGIELSDQHF